MFIGTSVGMVSATTRPPSSRARVDACICRGIRSGTVASMVRTFQLIGRPATALICASSSISSSSNLSRQPDTMPSRNVPSCSPTALHSASSSSLLAQREATGLPSPSECVCDSVVEKPSAPASSDSCRTRTISAICSALASLPIASAPMTYRRSAQCPTRKPALRPTRPSSTSRYSAKLSHFQSTPVSSAASGMPSTLAIMRRR